MNYTIVSGTICTVPEVKLVALPGHEPDKVFVCKFVVAVEEQEDDKRKYDFFQCLTFDKTASAVNDGFFIGAKIEVMGKMKNFHFLDDNDTSHYTNFILAEHIEFGDSKTAFVGQRTYTEKGKPLIMPIFADLKQMNMLFNEMSENGFLCISENDYYNIAMHNVKTPD